MERMTKRLASGAADYAVNMAELTHPQKSAYRQKCIKALATYEETGLEPEEVAALVKARDVVVKTAADREYIDYICPKCRNIISQRRKGQKGGVYKPKHHDHCGQRLNWTSAEAEAALEGGVQT